MFLIGAFCGLKDMVARGGLCYQFEPAHEVCAGENI
jgi:hypothetical protein